MGRSVDTASLTREVRALRKEARRKLKNLHLYNGTPRLLEEQGAARRLLNEALKVDARIQKLKARP